MSMHEIDLTRMDLNLLVVFEALLRERHVGRAAATLSLSQSATSHALGRLRTMFDDPLFVRHPRGVEPTTRARELAEPIADALARVRRIMAPQPTFEPATLQRTFTVATHDYALAVLAPALMAELRAQAPGVHLRCVSADPVTVVDGLDRGEFDFALGGFVDLTVDRMARTVLFSDRFVGVARIGHPDIRDGRMQLDTFAALPHVLMSATNPPRGDVDQALSALGLKRRIVVTVPTFHTLPYVLEASDVVGVLPERLARRVARNLEIFELPVEVGAVTCSMLVPAPLVQRPEIVWFTALLRRAAAPGR